MKKLYLIIVLMNFSLCHNLAFALSVQTHEDIDEYIVTHALNGFSLHEYLKNNLGIVTGITTTFKSEPVVQLFRDGGLYEDIPIWYEPYLRSVNHFHDPTKRVDQAGFTGIWGSGILHGKSAVLWSQSASGTQSPGGRYSWNDVRNYYYMALTAAVKTVRETNFADTFRGLGQLMHLVQDMSVPEHARDDGHYADAYEEWVRYKGGNLLNVAFSNPIFLDPSALVQPSHFATSDFANFGSYAIPIVPIANLFDTRQYYHSGNPNVTTPISSPTDPIRIERIGLAEYTNANYVSADTIFTVFIYPSPTSSVIKTTREYHNPLNPTESVQRPYWLKNADGDTGYLLAGVDYIHFWGINNNMPSLQAGVFVPPMDENVYADYATRLLPRAVGYSSEILNYFFRGSLSISAPDRCLYGLIDGSSTPYTDLYGHQHQQFTTIKAKVINTSHLQDQAGNNIPEAIQNGTLQAVAKYKIRKDYSFDLSNDPPTAESIGADFSYSVSEIMPLTPDLVTALNGTIPKEFAFDFGSNPIPAGITDLYFQVVFKGALGNESDNAIAVGFKDISEPTHIDIFNTTDYTYQAGQLQESSSGQRVTLTEKITFCPSYWPLQSNSNEYNVTYTSMSPGQFGRIIVLSDPGMQIFYGITDIPIDNTNAPLLNNWYAPWMAVNQDGKIADVYEFRDKGFHEATGYLYQSVDDGGFWFANWPPPAAPGDAITADSPVNW